MLHAQLAQIGAIYYHDASVRNVLGITVSLALSLVIDRVREDCYMEFPKSEPMVNVIATINAAEQHGGVVFDAMDTDLWEEVDGGFRLHGMFRDSL